MKLKPTNHAYRYSKVPNRIIHFINSPLESFLNLRAVSSPVIAVVIIESLVIPRTEISEFWKDHDYVYFESLESGASMCGEA